MGLKIDKIASLLANNAFKWSYLVIIHRNPGNIFRTKIETCYIFRILENFEQNKANFTKKWVTQHLKSWLLKITFFNRSSARNLQLGKWPKKLILQFFWLPRAKKWKLWKSDSQVLFGLLFTLNLAKFKVYTTFLAEDLLKNVILSNRVFKSRATHFSVKLALFCSQFSQILKI